MKPDPDYSRKSVEEFNNMIANLKQNLAEQNLELDEIMESHLWTFWHSGTMFGAQAIKDAIE